MHFPLPCLIPGGKRKWNQRSAASFFNSLYLIMVCPSLKLKIPKSRVCRLVAFQPFRWLHGYSYVCFNKFQAFLMTKNRPCPTIFGRLSTLWLNHSGWQNPQQEPPPSRDIPISIYIHMIMCMHINVLYALYTYMFQKHSSGHTLW